MAANLPLPAAERDSSLRFRRFSRWVSRIGAWRATLLTVVFASLGSFTLTWLSLHLVGGHSSMGNAAWISVLVPVPLALVFGGTSMVLVIALEQAWSTVNELAMVDSLTGLSNRHHFVPAAEREIELAQRHQQPLALLLLDMDHFKAINDRHGHLAGDLVLVEVGKRCRETLRTTDLLARWGGEEFIMLLPNTSQAQAQQLAERVRAAVSASAQLVVDGQSVQVTVSVGVAGAAGTATGPTVSLEMLIQQADEALYRAKHAGRDQVSMSGQKDTLVGGWTATASKTTAEEEA